MYHAILDLWKAANVDISPPNRQNFLCDTEVGINIEFHSDDQELWPAHRREAINGFYEKQEGDREALPFYKNKETG